MAVTGPVAVDREPERALGDRLVDDRGHRDPHHALRRRPGSRRRRRARRPTRVSMTWSSARTSSVPGLAITRVRRPGAGREPEQDVVGRRARPGRAASPGSTGAEPTRSSRSSSDGAEPAAGGDHLERELVACAGPARPRSSRTLLPPGTETPRSRRRVDDAVAAEHGDVGDRGAGVGVGRARGPSGGSAPAPTPVNHRPRPAAGSWRPPSSPSPPGPRPGRGRCRPRRRPRARRRRRRW